LLHHLSKCLYEKLFSTEAVYPGKDDLATLEIIDKALMLAGKESKKLILDYIQERYKMDLRSLVRYKDEFTNYLQEMLGDSAEIITTRINQALEEYTQAQANNDNKVIGPLCYICNRSYIPEKMRQHLMHDHTREEVVNHLAVIYIDDWHEEAELQAENTSHLQQLLHN
jgi:hypothetical protein